MAKKERYHHYKVITSCAIMTACTLNKMLICAGTGTVRYKTWHDNYLFSRTIRRLQRRMDEIAADKVYTELHFLTSITQNKSS
jgi:hypothetical protein